MWRLLGWQTGVTTSNDRPLRDSQSNLTEFLPERVFEKKIGHGTPKRLLVSQEPEYCLSTPL